MNGKTLQIVLAVATFIGGLAAGAVGATWAMDDRVDAKIDRAIVQVIGPIREDVREIKRDMQEIRRLIFRYGVPGPLEMEE